MSIVMFEGVENRKKREQEGRMESMGGRGGGGGERRRRDLSCTRGTAPHITQVSG